MEKGVFYKKGNTFILQEAEYIEDGFYIEIKGNEFILFEIPLGGGEPIEIDTFYDLSYAIDYKNTLT